jgi:hypothetical protein
MMCKAAGALASEFLRARVRFIALRQQHVDIPRHHVDVDVLCVQQCVEATHAIRTRFHLDVSPAVIDLVEDAIPGIELARGSIRLA